MSAAVNLSYEVVVPHTCSLGEGPVWDAVRKTICWLDILNGEIHEFSPEQKTHKTIPVHQMIGSLAVCTNGNFIAALQNGFAFINRVSGEVKILANPEIHLPNNRFNEGKCDPAGRFWAGSMSLSEEYKAGNVYVIQANFLLTKKIQEVTISNGMAWSLDDQTFYYIDTPTLEIVAYDYDKTGGHINNKRTIIKITEENGYPDGMTIDSEGMLWVALWDGWQVTRWNPNSGEKLYTIKLPVAKVTSCTFGGENLEDLYITSAKVGLTEHELEKQPLAGSLFIIRNCGFKGTPAFEFTV
ncbi:MAG: SMP-30/gluconolactonase/LRE family protein [Chitinophagaceae bacterium]